MLSKSRLLKLVAGGLSLLTIASAGAQVTKQGSVYSFRMKFVKGQRISYVTNMTGTVMGQKLIAKMPISQQTLAVQGDVATVKMAVGNLDITINGQPFNRQLPKEMQSGTMQIDSKGHVAGGPQQQTNVVLPDKPVPIGGTWTARTTIATAMAPSMDVIANYKFVGMEKLAGYNAAKFTFTMKEAAPKAGKGASAAQKKMAVSGKGTLWVNAADCSMVKSQSNMSLTMGTLVTPMLVTISRK